MRRLLLDADDPYQLLFVDIPEALEASGEGTAPALRTVLSELDHAYPDMIEDLKTRMLEGLKHRDAGNLSELVERARRIAGHGGDDLKLRGFITRLAEFDGSTEPERASNLSREAFERFKAASRKLDEPLPGDRDELDEQAEKERREGIHNDLASALQLHGDAQLAMRKYKEAADAYRHALRHQRGASVAVNLGQVSTARV